LFEILNFGHCDLPFDLAHGGESFDSARDREPVERLVEPFGICDLLFYFFFLKPESAGGGGLTIEDL
jgi:hypothetical protein